MRGRIARRSIGTVAAAALVMLPLGAPAPFAAAAKPDKIVVSVTCVDWFLTGGQDQHIHIEFHVKDQDGNGVEGVQVMFDASYDRQDGTAPFVYLQDKTATTTKKVGRNKGLGCVVGTASPTTTDWFCCIGAGMFDGEIPGKRSCPAGLYEAVINNVVPPQGMVWDHITPDNGVQFTPSQA
jgi:hypothetical protein